MLRGQVPGTALGGARTKSAINNTQASGNGLRRAGVSALEPTQPYPPNSNTNRAGGSNVQPQHKY